MKKHYTLTLLALVFTVAVSAQTLSIGASVGGGGWAFPNLSSNEGATTDLNSILNRYAQVNAEAQLRGPWHLASSLRYEQRYYDAINAFGYSNQVVNRLILPLEMRWHYRNLSVGVGAYAGYRFGEAYSTSLNRRLLANPSFALIDCLCYYVPPVQEDRRINVGVSASFSYRPLLSRNLRALIEYNPMFDLNTGGEYDGTSYRSLSGTLGLLYEIN
jgi:hypothetical protein